MHVRAALNPSAVGDPIPAHAPEIAELIRGGQYRDAIAACAREHGAVLGRLCMALLGSQADADEATQETLLRAHRGIDGSSRIADRERFLDVRRAPTICGL